MLSRQPLAAEGQTPLPGKRGIGKRLLGKRGKCHTPATSPEPLREERLPKERPCDVIVPLNNGAGHMRLIEARVAQEELRLLVIDHSPAMLAALHALVEGRGGEVSDEQRRILKTRTLLTKTGKVRPDIKSVIIAGFRATPAGPVITEPLDLSDPAHAAASQQDHAEEEETIHRWRRLRATGLWNRPDDGGQDRSR